MCLTHSTTLREGMTVFTFWTMMNLKQCVKPHCRITSCESRLHAAQTILLYVGDYFSFRWDHPWFWQGQILAWKVTFYSAYFFASSSAVVRQTPEYSILQPHDTLHGQFGRYYEWAPLPDIAYSLFRWDGDVRNITYVTPTHLQPLVFWHYVNDG